MKPLKLLSLFSGIGAWERALENEGIPFELVAYCEIDKYAAKAYSLIHGVDESMNLGDITKVVPQELPDFDMMTFSFPCQDLSVAGKQGGAEKDSGTRSSLLWTAVDIIKEKKPRLALFENVPNLLSNKHLPVFIEYLRTMTELGYESTFNTLNAKDFGVPQNRLRLFCISRLRNEN